MKKSLLKIIMTAGAIIAPMFVANIHAQTGATWNSGASSGLWTDPANWGGTVPTSGYKAFFNVGASGDCIIDSTVGGCQLAIGDGGGPCTIIVTNGGNLSAGDTGLGNLDQYAWTGLGWNNVGSIIIENGGSVTFNYHLWIGHDAGGVGTLTINGGTATVIAAMGLGAGGGSGGIGTIHMNGGTLNLNQANNIQIPHSGSVIDVTGGTIIIAGNSSGMVNSLKDAGKITAYGGTGTLNVDFDNINPGQTTVTATPSGGGTPPQQSIGDVTVDGGGNVTITYATTPGFTYHLESSPTLSPASWSTVSGSTTNATGGSVTFTTPQSSSDEFFRSVSP